MKLLKLFIVCVVFVMAFSSCKKDWTCTCTILGVESASTLEDASKGDAQDACDALEAAAKIADPAATCELD